MDAAQTAVLSVIVIQKAERTKLHKLCETGLGRLMGRTRRSFVGFRGLQTGSMTGQIKITLSLSSYGGDFAEQLERSGAGA